MELHMPQRRAANGERRDADVRDILRVRHVDAGQRVAMGADGPQTRVSDLVSE